MREELGAWLRVGVAVGPWLRLGVVVGVVAVVGPQFPNEVSSFPPEISIAAKFLPSAIGTEDPTRVTL